MDSEARGEATAPVVIHDGAELFLLAQREGAPEGDPERAIAFGVTDGRVGSVS